MAEKKKKVSPKKAPAKTKSSVKSGSKTTAKKVTSANKPITKNAKSQGTEKVSVVHKISAPRIPVIVARKPVRAARVLPQYAYMNAPGMIHDFQVGDKVEVFCDHEKGRERVRGWIAGIVVQVDNKMVAVQFRSNVFLTDGWMVPDRILWYPLNSEHIRPDPAGKKAQKKDKAVPDY